MTVVAAAILAVLAITSTAASASTRVHLTATAPADEILDLDAKPVITWSVPGRYTASWDAYNPATGYYRDFVNPTSWPMNLNGCTSTSKWRITSYTFTVTHVTTNWTQSRTTTACNLTLHTLPAQGLYRLSLVLHTNSGAFVGVSRAATGFGEIRDYLIVSMGDSLASGEGNPDVPGDYDVTLSPSLDPISVTVKRPAQWKDRRCHRSAKSGPALAAKAYEDASPYSSVTFVSVACSGAEVRHLIGDTYAGMEPTGGPLLPPQIQTVMSLVGPASVRGGRAIDALLVSAGINNLGFSDIIRRCVFNNNFASRHEECVTAGGIEGKIADLHWDYTNLALSLAFGLPHTREIYMNDYPANLFLGGACGLLAGVLPGLGIDGIEGQEMEVQGTALNWKVSEATHAFRQYQWNRIGSLTTMFNGHDYCASGSWFTSLERSLDAQGNVDGTAHPNAAGHVAYGNMIRQAMVLNQTSQPYRKLTITIEAVKAVKSPGSPFAVNPVMWQYQNDPYGKTFPLSIPRNGLWTTVAESAGTFTLDVFRPPASPRHAIELYISVGHILPIHHTFNDGFGVGTHEITNPNGSLAVRYRISSQTSGPPGNG